jgi:hypothetical protein
VKQEQADRRAPGDTMTQNNFAVGSQVDLNNAIETIDSTTTAGTYTITLTGDMRRAVPEGTMR